MVSSFFFDNICFPELQNQGTQKDCKKSYSLNDVEGDDERTPVSSQDPPLTFCGFYGFDNFVNGSSSDEAREESPGAVTGSSRKIADDNDRDTDEYVNDDDTVVSSSGVSVLSIDYEKNHIEEGGKVDLNNIDDDDESTVASDEGYDAIEHDETIDPNLKVKKPEQSNKRPEPTVRNSSLSPSTLKRKQSESSGASSRLSRKNASESTAPHILKGNTRAETKRKELVKTLRSNITNHGRYSLEVAHILVRIGEFHETYGQDETSCSLYLEAIDIFSSKLGDNDSNVTDLLLKLGQAKARMGLQNEALDLFTKAFFMISAMLGEYETDACNARVEIARIIQMKGFHKEAVKELKKALRGFREKYGDEHISVAETVDTIAEFYSEGGNHTKANNVRGELVKLRVALHGTKSIDVATSLEKWASTHEAIGDLSGALGIMKQAYVMFHEIEGPDGVNAEGTLEKIGLLYSLMGRSDKAIKAHTSVALTRKMRYGDHSVELAGSYLMLGKAYLDDSNPERALKALNRAMSNYNRANEGGEEYISELMDSLHTIGTVHRKNEDHIKALKSFLKENSIRKQLMKEDDIGMGKCLHAIASAYYSMKKYSDCESFSKEALLHFDQSEGRKIAFAESLFQTGKAMEALGKKDDAMTCYRETVMIFMANAQDEESNSTMDNAMERLTRLSGKANIKISPSLKCTILEGQSSKFEM